MDVIKDICQYSFVNFFDLDIKEKEMVLEWRNHLEIRKWMYYKDIVAIENHLQFIDRLKEDKTKLYYLVKRNNISIGVFSLVGIVDNIGEWGYYIAPSFHHKNLGVEFYYFVLKYIFESLNFSKIIGFTLIENKPANSFNDLFGFTKAFELKTEDEIVQEYYYRILTFSVWTNEVVNHARIMKLLQLTFKK